MAFTTTIARRNERVEVEIPALYCGIKSGVGGMNCPEARIRTRAEVIAD